MRVALVLVALAACKDPPASSPPPAPASPRDAAPLLDAVAHASPGGPVLDLVGCAPAPAPPSETDKASPATATLGPVSVPAIGKVLAAHANRITFCYEQNLGRRPDLAGRSKLALIVEPKGSVHEVVVQDSLDSELSLCLKHIISELRFPPMLARTTATTTIDFAWRHPPTKNIPLTAWIPYASGDVLSPVEDAVIAAVALKREIPASRLAASCLLEQTGNLRAIVRVGTAGAITEAHAGGFGDAIAETCIERELRKVTIAPPAHEVEVACDFVRGTPAPWRVSVDGGYSPSGAGRTNLVVVEPSTSAREIAALLAKVAGGAATVIAMHVDDGPPLFVAATRHAGVVADPARPLVVDAREPLRVCGGNLSEPRSAPFAEASTLFAQAAKTCTHAPRPTQVTITLAERTGDELASLVAAARRAGFERIRLGAGRCAQ